MQAFCHDHAMLKGNCCILRIRGAPVCQKVPKSFFQSQFSMSKIIFHRARINRHNIIPLQKSSMQLIITQNTRNPITKLTSFCNHDIQRYQTDMCKYLGDKIESLGFL